MGSSKVFKMKKVLILVMSHEGDETFKQYKEIWNQKINIIKHKFLIDVLFLYSDEKLDTDFALVGDRLISKCEENYWQALLTKTITGFKYFSSKDYDLVFKTNLSTIINFDKFYEYCLSVNCENFIYEGRVGKHLDYEFCSGAGMLLNKKTVNLVLNNINKIDDTWTDDIFIGYVLNKLNGIQPIENGLNRFDILSEITLTNEIKNYTHIRIKIRKEDKDYFYSKKVFNILYS